MSDFKEIAKNKIFNEEHPGRVLFVFLTMALMLRLVFFVGFGLGDDPYYSGVTHLISE